MSAQETRPTEIPSMEPMEEPKPTWMGTSAEQCQHMIDHAKKRNPMVRFMIEKMEEVRFFVSIHFR